MKPSRPYHIVVASVMLITGLPLQAESLRYAVKVDLGVGIYATKLNDLDQIIVNRQGTPGVWSSGTGFVALPAPIGVTAGFAAVDLNDKGEVIGTMHDERGSLRGLFWNSLTAPPIPIAQGKPVAINARSHIALWASDPLNRPLIWSNGKTIALANYNSGLLLPEDINDEDAVATISTSQLGVLVTQTAAHEIAGMWVGPAVSPDLRIYVNNAGTVAGNSLHYTGKETTHRAFVWTPESGAIDLGTQGNESSFVMGLDDQNRVLGYLDRNGGTPFVWRAGIGMTELTSLIDLGTQYARMQSVVDITSQGDILGSLLDQEGRPHIVVLVPVPEPAVWLIGAVGILGLLFKYRRARMHVWSCLRARTFEKARAA